MGKEDLTEKDVISACIKANAHEFIERLPNRYQTRIGEGGIRLASLSL
jgi:ABC-type multidrug transport system fused ATPase/permease subunit